MPGHVNGLSLAQALGGGVILWSGIKGEPLSDTFKGLLSGTAPTASSSQAINTTSADTAAQTDLSTGTPLPGITQGMSSGITGTNESVMKQVAAQHGWTGSEWTALYNVEMAEAGFNLTAQNPTSNAYGEAQFINGASEYAQYGGNSTSALGQAVAMCNYIEQRYGTPSAAWAHEQEYHWY